MQELIDLYLFLPVYNRGNLTASFLEHIIPLVPPQYCLKPIILDDRSTDNTVDLALSVCPKSEVVTLSGTDYWGGSLNRIRNFICSANHPLKSNHIYMVCNDDIRFQGESLAEPLRIISSRSVISVSTIFINSSFSYDLEADFMYKASRIEPMQYFDASIGKFIQTYDPELVNVCETRALITTAEPWLSSNPIPRDVPHYLSDFWLTYSFAKNGYQITYPPSFVCLNSLLTTNNNNLQSLLEPTSGLSGYFPKENLGKMLSTLCASVRILSPAYAPAWIAFLGAFSRQKNLQLVLLRYRIIYAMGSLLVYFSRFLCLANSPL